MGLNALNRRLVLLIVATSMAIGITANAEAQTPPAPYNTTVAVMVDSLNGDTKSTIDCRRDGQFETINGDATLIMVNRQPHKMICVITIRVATPVG